VMSRRAKVTLTVSIGVFMASLDLFIVNIAFPDIQRNFKGVSLAGLSWVLNAYAITFAALLVPAGRWADRAGRKRGFLFGLALFSAASAACAAAPSVAVLVAARVVQATGAAFMLPTSLGLLLPEFPAHKRGAAVGIWAAVGGVAAAAGPPIGGLLVQAGWRWVFIVNVPIGIGAFLAASSLLREVRDDTGPRPDLIGAALFTAGIAAVTLAIVEGPRWGWSGGRVVGLFVAAGLLLFAVAVRSARHPAPLIEPVIVRTRAIALANLGALLFFCAFGAFLLGSVLRFDREQYTWRSGSSQLLRRRQLTWGSNLFHVGILVIFLGHFGGLLTPIWVFDMLGVSHGFKQMLAIVAGGVAGLMCLVGISLLTHRRLFDPRIRANSSFGDTAILLLLFAQLLLGLATIPVSMGHLDGHEMVKFMAWAQGILTLQPGVAAYVLDVHPIFKAHLLLGMTIFLLFPFTRLVHVWSAPVWYLGRRGYQVVRSRDGRATRPLQPAE